MKKTIKKILLLSLFLGFIFFPFSNIEARSGCCSHHGGVRPDGCGCNDGTSLSATCAPYYTCHRVSNTSHKSKESSDWLYWIGGIALVSSLIWWFNRKK